MTVALRFSSAFNLILALVVLFIQSVILTSYKEFNNNVLHDTGVGLWTGVLLALNGISILLNVKRKYLCDPSKMYTSGLLLCIGTLIASLILTGVAAATYYGQLARLTHKNVKFREQSVLGLIKFEDDLMALQTLEGTLFGCGIASIIINTLSIVYLCSHYHKMIYHQTL